MQDDVPEGCQVEHVSEPILAQPFDQGHGMVHSGRHIRTALPEVHVLGLARPRLPMIRLPDSIHVRASSKALQLGESPSLSGKGKKKTIEKGTQAYHFCVGDFHTIVPWFVTFTRFL